MKKFIYQLATALMLLAVFNACVKPDLIQRNEQSNIADVWVEIPGVKERFNAVFNTQRDTAFVDMSYFFPAESDIEVDLTNLILRTSIPVDAKITPALGAPQDLSKPVTLRVTSGTGQTSELVVVVRKLGDLSVKKAEITYMDAGVAQKSEAIPNGSELVFFVLPGTDLSAVQLDIQVSRHSQVSIASGSTINLNSPVPVTVTAIDGRTMTYTLLARAPQKLDYGIGISRKLWQKSGNEMIPGGFATHNETSIAVSGDHLILVSNTTPSKFRVYNRMTGAYVQDMKLPTPTYRSFQIAADTSGNIITTNLTGVNGVLQVYKYTSALDQTPVKLIEWTNTIATPDNIGRRVNIYGDINKDAIIMATNGRTKTGLRWYIRNGVVENNQEPEVFEYQSIAAANWNYVAEMQPIAAATNSNYFISYNAEVALVNGATHQRIAAINNDPSVIGLFRLPIEYFRFNNANYLAVGEFVNRSTNNNLRLGLYDVTETSRISLAPNHSEFSKLKVFTSPIMIGTDNGNGTADIAYKYSEDRNSVYVYLLLTNGGVMAYEFTAYAP